MFTIMGRFAWAAAALAVLSQSMFSQIDCAPPPPPPCTLIRNGEILFTGVVLDDGANAGFTEARLEVDEVFAGLAAGTREATIEVPSFLYRMVKGRRYLVDARPDPKGGRIGAIVCGGTTELRGANASLEYFRERAAGMAETSLSVAVYASGGPLPAAQVTIAGRSGSITRSTDIHGVATFDEVEPGGYGITARKHGYRLQDADHQKVLYGACISSRLILRPDPSAPDPDFESLPELPPLGLRPSWRYEFH